MYNSLNTLKPVKKTFVFINCSEIESAASLVLWWWIAAACLGPQSLGRSEGIRD